MTGIRSWSKFVDDEPSDYDNLCFHVAFYYIQEIPNRTWASCSLDKHKNYVMAIIVDDEQLNKRWDYYGKILCKDESFVWDCFSVDNTLLLSQNNLKPKDGKFLLDINDIRDFYVVNHKHIKKNLDHCLEVFLLTDSFLKNEQKLSFEPGDSSIYSSEKCSILEVFDRHLEFFRRLELKDKYFYGDLKTSQGKLLIELQVKNKEPRLTILGVYGSTTGLSHISPFKMEKELVGIYRGAKGYKELSNNLQKLIKND